MVPLDRLGHLVESQEVALQLDVGVADLGGGHEEELAAQVHQVDAAVGEATAQRGLEPVRSDLASRSLWASPGPHLGLTR